MTITIGRTWNMWASRYANGALWNTGDRGWVQLHGLSEPTVPVLVEEILGDVYAPEVTHYGWADTAKYARHDGLPSMIQIRTGTSPDRAMMLLRMCFPYGIESAIQHGEGKVVALRITEVPKT
jgi:hypothetical protein